MSKNMATAQSSSLGFQFDRNNLGAMNMKTGM